MVIDDPEALVTAEREQQYREAVERSRQEAQAERKAREQRIRERIEPQDTATSEQQQGPLLMLTAGPANPLPMEINEIQGTADCEQQQSLPLMITAGLANLLPMEQKTADCE